MLISPVLPLSKILGGFGAGQDTGCSGARCRRLEPADWSKCLEPSADRWRAAAASYCGTFAAH